MYNTLSLSMIICMIATKRLFTCLHNPNESFRPQYSKMNFNSHVIQILLDKPLYVYPIIIIPSPLSISGLSFEIISEKENQKIFFLISHITKRVFQHLPSNTHVLECICANYKLVRVYILNWIIYQRPKKECSL